MEALSRGAESVVFVDASSGSINVLRRNLEKLKLKHKSTVIRMDALRALKRIEHTFQMIFADPPYLRGLIQRIVDLIARSEVLERDGILVLEHHKKETFSFPPEKLSLVRQKRFGDTVVSLLLKRPIED